MFLFFKTFHKKRYIDKKAANSHTNEYLATNLEWEKLTTRIFNTYMFEIRNINNLLLFRIFLRHNKEKELIKYIIIKEKRKKKLLVK